MWEALFERAVRETILEGALHVTLPGGRHFTAGNGTGPGIAARLTDPSLPRRIVLNPDLGVGEGYMEGGLQIEGDDLRGFLDLAIRNLWAGGRPAWQRAAQVARRGVRRFQQWNPASRSRANVAHHYDLSSELYALFLDDDRQYSCAYFTRPDLTLDQAQAAKKAHIARKLCLEPGMRVLDIGCGWGGMALTLARDFGAHVTGVTLSTEQHAYAQARARDEGLSGQVEFRLMDYRDVAERFDRIVSVGMFEHVGVPHYREYFRQVHDRLAPEGVALIHTIGRTTPPGATSPWIQKYIFPGGYVPAMSEMTAAIEREGLVIDDMEVWRLHYAETLRHWHDRFTANEAKARALYDERFCRMWRYYLLACELTFRHGGQVVFQAQVSHHKQAVPLTRDYLYRGNDGAADRGLPHAAE